MARALAVINGIILVAIVIINRMGVYYGYFWETLRLDLILLGVVCILESISNYLRYKSNKPVRWYVFLFTGFIFFGIGVLYLQKPI